MHGECIMIYTPATEQFMRAIFYDDDDEPVKGHKRHHGIMLGARARSYIESLALPYAAINVRLQRRRAFERLQRDVVDPVQCTPKHRRGRVPIQLGLPGMEVQQLLPGFGDLKEAV